MRASRGAWSALRAWWLGRAARRDSTPRGWLRWCEVLEQSGETEEALDAARDGLRRFPHSVELQDVVRRTWRLDREAMVRGLERRLKRAPSRPGYLNLVRDLVRDGAVDDALRVAESMVRAFPRSAECAVEQADVLLLRYDRDHFLPDGECALRAFAEAARRFPEDIEAQFGLARAYAAIGATAKARFQALLAADLDRNHPGPQALLHELASAPTRRTSAQETERRLLEAAERHEGRAARKGPLSPRLAGDILRGLGELSRQAGVLEVAASFHGQRFRAEEGAVDAERGEQPGLPRFAEGFREAATLACKRMGLGAFQEAEILHAETKQMIFAAGAESLAVSARARMDPTVIAADARTCIATWAQAEAAPRARSRATG